MTLTEINNKLLKLQGRKELLQKQYEEATKEVERLHDYQILVEQTQQVINDTARNIQAQLAFQLQDIVQTALDSVFEDGTTFQMDFVTKANRTAVDMYLFENGHRVDLIGGSGGGLCDIVTFALRLATWALGKTDNFMVFDEPFKWLSERGDLRMVGAEIFKTLTEQLGIQVVLVTHMDEFMDIADRVFIVEKRKGRSHIIVKESK